MPECRLEIWAGLECTINRVGDVYFDQLNCNGHYRRTSDADLIADLGATAVRFPVLWEKHQPEKTNAPIDWQSAEQNLNRLRERGVEPIVGLVHHGSGPRYVNFFDGSFESGLSEYAKTVALKFSWVQRYTPVNEPLTTARFCGLYGHWFPHERSDAAFARILLSECKATVMSMKAIREINPNAQLVQTDDLGKTYSTPRMRYQADFENERRWLSWDLISGLVDRGHPMWSYLIWSGVEEKDLFWFLENGIKPDLIGLNHYITSERFLDHNLERYPTYTHGSNGKHRYADVEAVRVKLDEPTGADRLLREAWERYKSPLAVTEVHLHCSPQEQLRWFHHIWSTANALLNEGADIRAVTAWAAFGSHGWNRLLTQSGGDYEPGLFDVRSGEPQETPLAEMVRSLASGSANGFTALSESGWWELNERILYADIVASNVDAHLKAA